MQFPVGYTPSWHPSEDVVCDMVQAELDKCTPASKACTWIDAGTAESIVSAGGAIVRVHANPGTVQERKLRLVPIQLEVIAAKRSVSMQVFDYLSDVLCDKYERGGEVPREGGGTTHVRGFEISETQQQMVFVDPDERMVEGTFILTTGKRTK